MENLISLTEIDKAYKESGHHKTLLNKVSFMLKKSEFLAIFGPNGCGKTTLLNIISGLDIEFEGLYEKKSGIKISSVFQNYRESLFPWLTAEENIAFPLSLKKISRSEQKKTVEELCSKLKIRLSLEKYPYELSGGQQQMIAILRALIIKPDLMLMYEPFSALDYETTFNLLEKTLEIWRETGVAIIFISHDIDDAVLLAEKIIVLSKNPTEIVEQITNPLPYPRKESIVESELFHQIKNKVLSAFLQKRENFIRL